MPAKLVPVVKTTCNSQQLVKGFIEAWKKSFGEIPSKQTVGVLYAQNTLETGGTTAMWNWNIGNVKFVPSKNPEEDNDKEYMMLSNVWEIVNGAKVIFQPPHPATWFRSFPTLADGVAFHFKFLQRFRYRNAWLAVQAGDPVDFSKQLRIGGYYTAPEEDYTKLMTFYFNKYMKSNMYEISLQEINSDNSPVVIPRNKDVVIMPNQPVFEDGDKKLELTNWQKILNNIFKLFKK
jgi:hypothetical protein